RAGAAGTDLPGATAADKLLLTQPEADRQNPPRREGHQEVRHRADALPACSRQHEGHQEDQDRADSPVPGAEPGPAPPRSTRSPGPAPRPHPSEAPAHPAPGHTASPFAGKNK